MADEADADFDEVARNFATLWRALTVGEHGPHAPERRHFLIDQVRDALDRAEDRLDGDGKSIIANTFALETRIHEGAVIDIYRARHRDLGSLHAIKMLRPDRADDPIARKLLLREAEIGMAIHHVNVVTSQTVLRLGDGRPALVFEWLAHSLGKFIYEKADKQLNTPSGLPAISPTRGERTCGDASPDLSDSRPAALSPPPCREGLGGVFSTDRSSPDTSWSVDDITKIATAILCGLGAIHTAGFVHGDLSPANLLCDSENFSRLKIADFGVALETGRRHRDLDITFAGRPQFAPPEQLAGEALDARADLYAAGRIFTELLPLCREDTDRLEAFATELTRTFPDARPENAKAAQTMLDGFLR